MIVLQPHGRREVELGVFYSGRSSVRFSRKCSLPLSDSPSDCGSFKKVLWNVLSCPQTNHVSGPSPSQTWSPRAVKLRRGTGSPAVSRLPLPPRLPV